MRVTESLNNYALNKTRKDTNFCFHCNKRLSNSDKGKSRDYGLLDDELNPLPICVNSAYLYASIYIKEKGDAIFE